MCTWIGWDDMFWHEIKRVLHNRLCIISLLGFIALSLLAGYSCCFGTKASAVKREIASGEFVSQEGIHLAQYHDGYMATLDEEISVLDRQLESFLFEDKDTLRQLREIAQSLKDTGIMLQCDIPAKDTMALLKYASIAYGLLGLSLIHCLLQEDKDNHMERLLASTASGVRKIALAKMTAMLWYMMAAFLTKAAIDCTMIKLAGIALQMPIQTVRGYLQLNGTWNIGQYIMLLQLQQWLCLVACLLLFVLLLETTNSHGIATLILVVGMTMEYLAYVFVSLSSPFVVAKKWNAFAFLSADHLDRDIGMPKICLLLLTSLTMLLWLSCLWQYDNKPNIKHRCLRRKEITSPCTWSYRSQEVLRTRKGALVITIIAIYCLSDMIRYETHPSSVEIEHDYLAQKYYGIIDEALIQRIEQDRTQAQEAANLYLNTDVVWSTMSEEEQEQLRLLQKQSDTLPAMLEIESEVKQLYANNAKYYADNDGIQLLFNANGSLSGHARSLLCLLPTCILTVTTISPLFNTGMWRMFAVAKKGKRQMMEEYLAIFMLLGIVSYVIVFGFHAGKVIMHFPFGEIRQRACDCLNVQSSMPMFLYVAIKIVLRLETLTFLVHLSMFTGTRLGVVDGIGVVALGSLVVIASPGISQLTQCTFCDHPYILIAGMLSEYAGIYAMHEILFQE